MAVAGGATQVPSATVAGSAAITVNNQAPRISPGEPTALPNPRIAALMISQLEPLTALLTEAIATLQASGRVADPSPARTLAERTQGGLLGGMLQLAVVPNFDIDAYLRSIEGALLGPTKH